MKKFVYLIVLFLVLGLIVSGCNPVVPPVEQDELGGQTKDRAVTVQLLDSTDKGLAGGVVQYYSGGWQTFGTTAGVDGKVSKDLPDGSYTFRMSYGGASVEKNQDITANQLVEFQTKLVTMKLLDSAGTTELHGGAEYYASGWKAFGGGTTETTMQLLPLTYTFRVSYGGASVEKNQNVDSNPVVIFQATKVTMQFSGQIQYYAGGWKTFTKPSMNLLPGTYTFKFDVYEMNITVSGPEMTKSIVIAKLLNSSGVGISGGAAQYYDGGWKVMGTTGSNGVLLYAIDGLKGMLSFKMSYGGASVEKSQNIATNSLVEFQTKLVTMKLLDSAGTTELHGGAQYYASGWKAFGGGTTETTMQLLPLTYTFRVSYGGASVEKNQKITDDPLVVFHTGNVHSGSVSCTQYYASGWKAFIQDMELLPVNYTFLFNDGTPQTSYLIVAGVVNNIH